MRLVDLKLLARFESYSTQSNYHYVWTARNWKLPAQGVHNSWEKQK